jgi:hypothetical protein
MNRTIIQKILWLQNVIHVFTLNKAYYITNIEANAIIKMKYVKIRYVRYLFKF